MQQETPEQANPQTKQIPSANASHISAEQSTLHTLEYGTPQTVNRRKHIDRILVRIIFAYIFLLLGSYVLVGQAQQEMSDAEGQYEMAITVSHEIEVLTGNSSRPSPSWPDDPQTPITVAIWTVWGTWAKMRKATDELQLGTTRQLEWADGVLYPKTNPDQN